MAIIRLTTCYDSYQAHLIKNNLERAGIKCFLTNENFSSLKPYGNMLGSGIQVMIEEQDFNKASAFIQEKNSSDLIKCPFCNSIQVTISHNRRPASKVFLLFMALLASLPFIKSQHYYYCLDCKSEFKLDK